MTVRLLASSTMIISLLGGIAVAQAPAPTGETAKQANSNERICEDIILTGSRLGKKRFCGTRAEWERHRLEDRQAVEKVQMSPCVVNGTTCK